jgi:hypothetical protein
MTPLPIGVGRKGTWVRSMNSRTSDSARAQAMPLPTIASGCSAFLSTANAAATSSSLAWGRGGGPTVAAGATPSSSTSARMMSSGMSR